MYLLGKRFLLHYTRYRVNPDRLDEVLRLFDRLEDSAP